MQDASHRKIFPFGLRPSNDVYTRQAAMSIQIQFGRQEPSGDLKVETRTRRDPLDIPCVYHKGARHTLRGCRLPKKIDQERDASHVAKLTRLQTVESFKRPRSASPPTIRDPPGTMFWWSQRTTHRGSARRILRKRVGSKATRTVPRGGRRSSARRYPRVPATYASSSKRWDYRRSTPPGQPGCGVGMSPAG
jgi:hypothetical protein